MFDEKGIKQPESIVSRYRHENLKVINCPLCFKENVTKEIKDIACKNCGGILDISVDGVVELQKNPWFTKFLLKTRYVLAGNALFFLYEHYGKDSISIFGDNIAFLQSVISWDNNLLMLMFFYGLFHVYIGIRYGLVTSSRGGDSWDTGGSSYYPVRTSLIGYLIEIIAYFFITGFLGYQLFAK